MGDKTKIEWTATPGADGTMTPGATWNPWHGCVKVSAGCKNCYAESQSARYGKAIWGPGARREMRSEAYWRRPEQWDRAALAAGVRRRVFCASMADVFEQLPFDHPDYGAMSAARCRLWGLVRATPNLDWLLLTKRPENVFNLTPATWEDGWPGNVWLGASVEDQATADRRIPELLQCPAAVRFLSCEPLLGPVDLTRVSVVDRPDGVSLGLDALHGILWACSDQGETADDWPSISWVIVGGESGPWARPCHTDAVREIVQQCRVAGVPVFVKQLGSNPVAAGTDQKALIALRDRKGGQISEWPEDLRVRQFPDVRPSLESSR